MRLEAFPALNASDIAAEAKVMGDEEEGFAYYLAGAGVTIDTLPTPAVQARLPALIAAFPEEPDTTLNAFVQGTGDADIITRAEHWGAIYGYLSDISLSRLHPDHKPSVVTNIKVLNEWSTRKSWVLCTYLAGYGVTVDMLTNPAAEPLFNALDVSYNKWSATMATPLEGDEEEGNLDVAAFIAGMEAVNQATHASYLSLIVEAITALKKGSSRAAIKKYIETNHKIELVPTAFTDALAVGVTTGQLVQIGQSYKLAAPEQK